jgi:predicted RNA-binding protein with PUA-like domain
MAHWLFKQEPECYSYDQLEADGHTAWDGVNNALAKKHLRSVALGDSVFFYHTGKVKAVVGIMEVTAAASETEDGSVSVEVKPVRRLKRPVTLAELKADERFAEWELLRISRLSVMPVPSAIWKAIEALAKKQPPAE